MDTRLNPNRPDEEWSAPETERREKHRDESRGRRGRVNKPLGILLLAAAVGFLSLGMISWVCLINAQNGFYIRGTNGTGIEFRSAVYGRAFAYEFGARMETLYSHLTADAGNYTVVLQESIATQAAATAQEAVSEQVTEVIEEAVSAPSVDNTAQIIADESFAEEEYAYTYNGSEADEILSNARDFIYNIYDSTGRLHYTNAGTTNNSNAFSRQPLLTVSLTDIPDELQDYSGYDLRTMSQTLRERGFQGEITIPYTAQDSDSGFSYTFTSDNYYAIMLENYRSMASVSIIGFIITMILGMFVFRPSFVWAFGKVYGLYGKQPLLMKLPLIIVGTVWLINIYATLGKYTLYNLMLPDYLLNCVLVLYMAVSLFYIGAVLSGGRRMLRSEPDIRWIRGFIGNMRIVFHARSKLLACLFILDTLLMVALLPLGCLGIAYIDEFAGVMLLLLVAAGLLFTGACLSLIFVHAKTILRTGDIAAGRYGEWPDEKGWFTQPLNNLSKINEGTRKAVDKAVRSERLKSELVTNVSHDLKTPLTSIMNYVALLKETSVAQTPGAAEYLDIIDKKTLRMQALIDDLFEAVKLNSGSVTLQPSDVNVVDLLKQAMGEMSERIDASGVQFVYRYDTERIMLWLDGKKIWRVFENLTDNILKYAPPGSRTYIDAEEQDGAAVLTFRNVSSYALDFAPEELFERFKRGDTSRSTDGNGLGLSIARGIVEQSGGEMHIFIDGDLFKVVLRFPSRLR